MPFSDADKKELAGIISDQVQAALALVPKPITTDDVHAAVKAELNTLPAPLLRQDVYDIVDAVFNGRNLQDPAPPALTDDDRQKALKIAPVLYPGHAGWKIDSEDLVAQNGHKQVSRFSIRKTLERAAKQPVGGGK